MPVYARIYRKNAGAHARDPHFVRAGAIEMHGDISEEPFCAIISRPNARAQIDRPP